MYKGVVCSSMEQKEGKHTFIILAKAQHERHHFQLRSTRCTLGKILALSHPLHIWTKDNNPTLGTAENPKGRAGEIMVKSYF